MMQNALKVRTTNRALKGLRIGCRKTESTMKEYFSHDFFARNDPKLQEVLLEHGVAGIGIYWCLVEHLYEQGGTLLLTSCRSIAFALHVDSNIVESVVRNFNLFQDDGERFWSTSVNERIGIRNEISEKRKLAALKRWESTKHKQEQCKCIANAEQDYAIKENKIKEKDIIKEENKEERSKTAKRFSPPSLEEVQAYIQEKGYTVDAEAFIAHYTSNGWMVGKNKMKDWRMAVVTWVKRSKEFRGSSSNNSQTKNANDEWK